MAAEELLLTMASARRLQSRADDVDRFRREHGDRAEQLQRVVPVAQLIGQDDAPTDDQLTQVGGMREAGDWPSRQIGRAHV